MPRGSDAAAASDLTAVERWLTAREAAALLGVSVATVYSYVSRRLLHPADAPGLRGRGRRFRRPEVERLKRRHQASRRPRGAAGAALDFGLPVLESSLCLIEQDHLYFRGRDVMTLAARCTLEEVAALLWDTPAGALSAKAPPLSRRAREALARHAALPWPRRLMAGYHEVVADWADAFAAAHATAAASPAPAGWLCVQAMAVAATGRPWASDRAGHRRVGHGEGTGNGNREGEGPDGLWAGQARDHAHTPVHRQLQRAWGLHDAAGDALRRALVLCADHELNVSSFTARCAASAGASLDAAVGAALAALGGPRHGGMVLEVEAEAPAIEATRGHAARLRRWISARPGPPAGFGHRLYPGGDPRGRELLRHLPADPVRERLVQGVHEVHGLAPTLDFGLVALCRSLGAPAGAPFAVFAVARTVGWVAHALEQRSQARLIRPRAAYVGMRPEEEAARVAGHAAAEAPGRRIVKQR